MNAKTMGQFPTTHWSDFAALHTADPQASEALERLCQSYWFPIYAFARQRGLDEEEARDLTQAFFERLLARQTLSKVSQDGGKFRYYLRTAFQNFLVDEWKHAQRQVRRPEGGWVALDASQMERTWLTESVRSDSPDRAYDRRCALALLEQTFAQIEAEYAERGRAEFCQRLRAYLNEDPDAVSHAQTAMALGISESAVKSELHRLRHRFREVLHYRVALTVTDPGQVEEELRHLLSALA